MRDINIGRIVGTAFACTLVHVVFAYAFGANAPFGGWPVAGKNGFSGVGMGMMTLFIIILGIAAMMMFARRGEMDGNAEKAREGSGWSKNRLLGIGRALRADRLNEDIGKLYNRPGMEPELMYRNRLVVNEVFDIGLRYDIYRKKKALLGINIRKIIGLREESSQKPYQELEDELVQYRSGTGQIKGWSYLIKESVDKLNEVYRGLREGSIDNNKISSSTIKSWIGALDSLNTQMGSSFKEHNTREGYLMTYQSLRARIMQLPPYQLSPLDELRFVRNYALKSRGTKTENELGAEWSAFLKDFEHGMQHPESRSIGDYLKAWEQKIFNDDKIPLVPGVRSESDSTFDWRALAMGSYSWAGEGKQSNEPHISVFGLWQFVDKLIDKISAQTQEDKKAFQVSTPYSSLNPLSQQSPKTEGGAEIISFPASKIINPLAESEYSSNPQQNNLKKAA